MARTDSLGSLTLFYEKIHSLLHHRLNWRRIFCILRRQEGNHDDHFEQLGDDRQERRGGHFGTHGYHEEENHVFREEELQEVEL